MKPVIGIPAQFAFGREEDGAASACRQVYIDSIHAADGLPLIIPLGLSEIEWQQFYRLVDGILLTGGCDVDPTLYGETPHPKLGELSARRDAVDSWFAQRAFVDDKPLLGICRGCQIMNVALGGTLYQDIPDQFKSDVCHRNSEEDRWEQLVHDITFESSSKVAGLFKDNRCEINSLHHQAVKRIASGLIVSARAADGMTEAIEAPHKKFFFGIQGHPETLWQNIEPAWRKLFEQFVDRCRL